MKRTFLTLSLIAISFIVCAQTQQGLVKTRGRLSANGTLIPGTRLSGATINIQNASSVVSGNNGLFSFAVPSSVYHITSVKKNGYQLCDNDMITRGYKYSSNPLVVSMETPDNATADRLAAEKKIRRTLQKQLQEKEDEIEALKEQQKITAKEYELRLQQLYSEQRKNDELIQEMAERYSTLDFDEMDDFQRKVAYYIQNGELSRADSLLNTKGSMVERGEELDRMDAAIKADAVDLEKRQRAHSKSVEMKAKKLADFAADCYSRYEICKIQHNNDSAAYWLELRASKDTTNGKWQVECGSFILNYLANFELSQRYMKRVVDLVQNDPEYSSDMHGASLANLADVYLKAGRYDDAIRLYTEARSKFKNNTIEQVAASVALANCYDCIKENTKALPYLREAYSVCQKIVDVDPKLLLRLYNQLGTNLCETGKFEEGKQFFDLSLKLAENNEEIDQPRQIVALYDMASFYRQINEYAKSMELYEKALKICLQIYDNKHPVLANIYNGLGVLYNSLSKLDESLDYLFKAKEINIERSSDESYAQTCSNIASVYLRKGNLTLAEQYEIEAFNTRSRIFGEDSPAMFDEYNALCALYCEKGDYDKALGYVEKAIAVRKSESGEMHPSFVASYSFMGGINLRLGRLDESLKWFNLNLDVAKHFYGDEHTITADAYNNIGGVNMFLEKYDDAISMLKESLRIHQSVYGETHASVAADYNGIAQTYMAMEKYSEALENFKKAIEIRKNVFGERSVKLKSLYEFMKQICEKLGDTVNAKLYDSLLSEIEE